MRQWLNNFITKRKGHEYKLDPAIPGSYLLALSLSRTIMLVRGYLSGIKNDGLFFLGRGVTLKARHKMRLGHSVTIGNDCYIDALSTEGISFGNNVSIGKNVNIECTGNLQLLGKGMKIGNNVGLGASNFFGCAGGIFIDDDTIMGNFISLHAENHVFTGMTAPIRLQGVTRQGITIGKNCWVGSKVTILDGAIIEDGCVIAAGAVVKAGRYLANGIYGGVPAKLIEYRNPG